MLPSTTTQKTTAPNTSDKALRLRRLAEYEPSGIPGVAEPSTGPQQAPCREPARRPRASGRRAQVTAPTRGELHRLLCGVLEVLDGRRPVAHLRHHLDERCYEAVRTRAAALAGRRQPHRLYRLRLSRPAPTSIELCAIIERGGRLQAAAGEVEIDARGWRCTTLRFL